jgi:UDP-N-acetylglucosamine diphosphorylase/glucosamine-1-phosphate N-acetyltransferase
MREKINLKQAVILAAGLGLRFRPLTETKPKPLLKVLDKTILEHNLEQLDGLVEEVILVVGYLKEAIKNLIGERYKSLKIKYVFQKKPLGTGDAARRTKPFLEEKFLLLNGDDIYDRQDIKEVLKKYPCILLARTKDSSNFGLVSHDRNFVKGIIEKPKEVKENLVNAGLYFLPKSILNFQIKKSSRGEYEFTDYINSFVKREKLFFVEAKEWYPLSYPWYLFSANESLLKRKKAFNKGKVEKNCTLKGKIIIEEGTVIKSGSYLQGPIYIGKNSEIGPGAFLKGPLRIGSSCRIGHAVEIKNSLIGDRVKVAHLSFIGDSIIGDNCNLGAGTILANLRFDRKPIKTEIAGKVIETKREKFGAILGDDVQIGVNSVLMPGINIGHNTIVGPNSLVIKNIENNKIFYQNNQMIIKEKS